MVEAETRSAGADGTLRFFIALLPPLIAAIVQLVLGDFIHPHVWFLFYPAVFISAWIGGRAAGVIATTAATMLAFWLFLAPAYSFFKPTGEYFATGVFFTTGVIFGLFHNRLRVAREAAVHALREARRSNDEIKRTREAAVRASEAFAALFQQAPDGIVVASADGQIADVNDAACRLLSCERDEVIGKPIDDLLPAEAITQLARQKPRMAATHGVLVDEWRIHRGAGSDLRVDVSASILSDDRLIISMRDNSVHRELEATLRESHADLMAAQSVAKLGSWRLDVKANKLSWSDEAYRIFGVPPGTAVTYDVFRTCVHPDDRALVDREWNAALHGVPYDIEHRIVVDGTIKWVREKASLEVDETMTLVGCVGITLDITARKHIEDELRMSEAKATGIVTISTDAIVSLDRDQQITLFNEGAQHLFGYTKSEALGARVDMLLPERFRGAHRKHIDGFAASEAHARQMGGQKLEIVGLRKNGEEFPAEAAISNLHIDGQRILTVVLRDVTQQRRIVREQTLLAEMGAVLASTLELSTITTSIGELTTQWLADACMIHLVDESGQARRVHVATRDPGKRWVCDALVAIAFSRSRIENEWAQLEENRSVLYAPLAPHIIERFAQSDEHLRLIRALEPRSAMLVPFFAHGRLVGGMTLVLSATDRIYTEHDLRFAEQVAQRAALALVNGQLYAKARSAIKSRDDVLGIVAHDLRNPLGAILMQASFLSEYGSDRESDMQAAALIERSALRMNRLIEDLLDMVQLEAGQLSVERTHVPTEQVIREAAEAERSLVGAASLELRVEVTRDVPGVWADRDRLLQIIENLIGNAIKFTRTGVTITVGAAPRNDEVLFWVADTGIGIAADNVPHLFEPFWQAQKGERRGAGLGLPIVKGLVEANGGRIWVETSLGRGSIFFFTMPVSRREQHEQPASP